MSLWYESLALDLYDCGNNREKRALCVLAYLSMPVPRQWWNDALQKGFVAEPHIRVLDGLLGELEGFPELAPFEDCGLLMALAFVIDGKARHADPLHAPMTMGEYVAAARKALAERPELRRLAASVPARLR